MSRGLLVLGFGGHARSVADVALACGYDDFLFVDDKALPDESFLGFPVRVAWPDVLPQGWSVLPASGFGRARQAQIAEVSRRGWNLATLIAPSATVGVEAVIGKGCFVGHHAHVGPMARVGQGCILNTGCAVEHESTVGDFTHVSVNTTIAGRSSVGAHCFIGAGATVIDGVDVCDEVTVGAGSVVIAPIREGGAYVGCPVRRIHGPLT